MPVTYSFDALINNVIAVVVFAVLGMLLFIGGIILFDKLTPGNFWKELLEEHNTALAILVGSVAIGLAIVIAAAIQ
jgi:putative membrane protein